MALHFRNLGNVQNLLSDPNIMHQLREMSATLQRTEQIKSELTLQEERHRLLQQQQHEFNQQIQQHAPPPHHQPPLPGHPDDGQSAMPPHHMGGDPMPVPPPLGGEMPHPDDRDHRDHRDKGRRTDRSRSRSPKRRRRSRSRSRDRDRRRRSRSHDGSRHRRSRSVDEDVFFLMAERSAAAVNVMQKDKKQTLPFDGHHGACACNCEVTRALYDGRVGGSWTPTYNYKDITLT